MLVPELYSSAKYEEGKKAVIDWQIWKNIVKLLKSLEQAEVELAIRGTLSTEALLIIEPDAKQAMANQPALALLQSLEEIGDETEQRQTWSYLQHALDEDRLSHRPLFPQTQ